jgi:uncharacterized protein YkwD
MRSVGPGLARGLALLAGLGLLAGCNGGSPAPEGAKRVAAAPKSAQTRAPARAAKPAARKPDLAQIEREVLQRVNRYRKTEGLPVLASDARIAEIAREHSRAMATGRTGFGHGGFKVRSQAVASRVPYRRVAENVARNARKPNEIPAVVVERWVDSRGHRRNIEGPFAVTGVGAARGADGSVYLTQLFVAPR